MTDQNGSYGRLRYAASGALAALAAVGAPPPVVDQQPFLNAIQRLIDDGTITATEGQAVDREIRAGRVDTDTLTSSGFSQAQLQAVQQALGNAKRALLPSVNRTTK
jgi:hypothetical protein